MKILVTGAAGFIGFHLSKALLAAGHTVTGIDSITDYYDVNLKYGRLRELGVEAQHSSYNESIQSNQFPGFTFRKLSIDDKENLNALFSANSFDKVCNLAAQVGVRYSLENPEAYIRSNINGFFYVLDACKNFKVKHLVYASSSSVYGLNKKMPFEEGDHVDHPMSLYAATKKADELLAHSYSHLYKLPVTGLRFFTVYGPWGRPDMAVFLFTKAITEGKPIQIFNDGNMRRDFTYVDDIVKGIVKAIENTPQPDQDWDAAHPDPKSSSAPYRVYNIGHSEPVKLLDMISTLENSIGIKAIKKMMPMQAGDLEATWGSTSLLEKDMHYAPSTSIEKGLEEFVKWYRAFYKVVPMQTQS